MKYIGIAMLVALLLTPFIFIGLMDSWKASFFVFLFTAGVLGYIFLATWFLTQ